MFYIFILISFRIYSTSRQYCKQLYNTTTTDADDEDDDQTKRITLIKTKKGYIYSFRALFHFFANVK